MKRPQSLPGLLLAAARVSVRRPRAARLAVGAVALAGAAVWGAAVCARPDAPVAAPRAAASARARALLARHATEPRSPGALLVRRLAALDDEDEPAPVWPALAWSGAGYGLTWSDLRGEGIEVYFARVAPTGERVGAETRLTTGDGFRLYPRVAWSGREYGLTWTDLGESSIDVGFARVTAEGQRAGEAQRLSTGEIDILADVAWSGREWGVAWLNGDEWDWAVTFARVSAAGERVGAPWVTAKGLASGEPAVAWGGREWGVALGLYDPSSDRTATTLLRVGEQPGAAPRVEVSRDDGWSAGAALAWDGEAYGVAWQDDLGITGRHTPSLGRASASGVALARRALVPRGSYSEPRIAWSGREYGVAWAGRQGAGFAACFARVSREGALVGQVVVVSTDAVLPYAPSVAWGGGHWALAWTRSFRAGGGVWFARVSPEGARVGRDVQVVGR